MKPQKATPIEIGPSLPQRGNGVTRWFANTLLRLIGWRIEGAVPDVPKMVAVMAPHTSNWDFIMGMLLMFALGVRFSWLGKDSLFRGPMGPLMRWLGGVPVRRNAPAGIVEQAIAAFLARDKLILVVTPEGTRRATGSWKTGFYRIAAGAGVPVLLGTVDYGRQAIILGPHVELTGDQEAEIEWMKAQLRSVQGKHPHDF